jgi:hypothetical protein
MLVLYTIGSFLTILVIAVIIRAIADVKLPAAIEQMPWRGVGGKIKIAYVHSYHKVLYYLILVFGLLEALGIIAIIVSVILWCFGIRG